MPTEAAVMPNRSCKEARRLKGVMHLALCAKSSLEAVLGAQVPCTHIAILAPTHQHIAPLHKSLHMAHKASLQQLTMDSLWWAPAAFSTTSLNAQLCARIDY